MTDPTPTHRLPSFWATPWGFPQACTIAIGWLGVGLVVQALYPQAVFALPASEWSWAIVFGPVVLACLARAAWPRASVLTGLGGVPMAIVAISAAGILSVHAAVWPQGHEAPALVRALGLANTFGSLGFTAAASLLLLNLALALGRHGFRPARGDVRFLLVHAGLLLAAGAWAASSSQRVTAWVTLVEGMPAHDVGSVEKQRVRLPWALALDRFDVDFFPATLDLIRDPGTERVTLTRRGEAEVSAGGQQAMGVYDIEVHTVREIAHPLKGPGLLATLTAKHRGLKTSYQGLVFAPLVGARSTEQDGLSLAGDDVLVLRREPRKYASQVRVQRAGAAGEVAAELAVNAPLRLGVWRLYQSGFDVLKDPVQGTFRRGVKLQAVYDPALPVVYAGLALLLAGCLWQLFDAATTLKRGEDAT